VKGKKLAKRREKGKKKPFRVRFIKRYEELVPKEEIQNIPAGCRGIYALLNKKRNHFNVVYMGMSTTGMKGRIMRHATRKSKKNLWSHFSIFEAYDNIPDDEIKELEGLFRVVYRKDERANILNKQRKFKGFRQKKTKLTKWEQV